MVSDNMKNEKSVIKLSGLSAFGIYTETGGKKELECKDKISLGQEVSADNDENQETLSRPNRQRQRNVIIGTSTLESNLKVVTPRTYFFVSRLDPLTTADSLLIFLKSKLSIDFTVEQLVTKHPQHYSSFKVGVPNSSLKDALVVENWPKGVFVKKFYSGPQKSSKYKKMCKYNVQ
uniref:Uncharacterized protein n=1 Tax=Cuerna arida TaxID=1464854 RepID=A0A1B6EXG8_9HEMI